MTDATAVLDASAVLALLQREPGEDVVAPFVGRGAWSTVNLCEVAGKLTDRGMPAPVVEETLEALHLTIHDFDVELGLAAAALRRVVPRAMGIGDRACLALALRLRVPAVTADREWSRLEIDDLTVTVIR